MKSYVPDTLPLIELDFRLLLPLVGRANAELARYDGLLQGIPNPAVMLSPLTTQEAVLSSRIEGTQATMDEVLGTRRGCCGKAKSRATFRKFPTTGGPCIRRASSWPITRSV